MAPVMRTAFRASESASIAFLSGKGLRTSGQRPARAAGLHWLRGLAAPRRLLMSHASSSYDVIVVGARCAGSPTAMLLALKGYKVLLLDRARFPSDTVSTHIVHPLASAALARWGLLDRLAASGCPPIDTYAFDFGPFTIEGSPATQQTPPTYCPRRTVLDKTLVEAAAEAGAHV